MHGEVREEDDDILLDTDDEPGVPLILPPDDLHVVTSLEMLLQLMGREL